MAQWNRPSLAENSGQGADPTGADAVPHEIEETVAELFCRFYEKFGRPPRMNDPVFFDPDVHESMPLPEQAPDEMWIGLPTRWFVREKWDQTLDMR